MDHIPQCSGDLVHRPLEVPFLATERFAYDELGMPDYPERVGVDRSLLIKDELPDLRVSGSASFLQAWLWFGIIHESLSLMNSGIAPTHTRLSWNKLDLVDTKSEKSHVSLRKFQNALDDLVLAGGSEDQVRKNWIAIQDRLRVAMSFTCEMIRKNPWIKTDPSKHKVSRVLLSTEILYQTITRVMGFRIPSDHTTSWPHGNLRISLDMVNALLISSKWCPKELERLPKDAIFRYHLSFYHPSILFQDPNHFGTNGCTCKSLMAKIIPTHTHAECKCQTVSISNDILDGIISRGEIPLLTFSEDSTGTRSLKLKGCLIDGQQTVPFVAISHVRTAGLGNEEENALPFCRLVEVQVLANELQESKSDTLIWLDTICLPIDRKGRKEALHSVWRIFNTAQHVLVLDPPLSSHFFSSAQEALIRIRYSLWKQRIWTLEEGFFSENLIFRFSSHMVSLSDLLRDFADSEQRTDPGSRILLSWPRPLTSEQHNQLPDLLKKFGDDIRLLSRNDHVTDDQGYDRCKRILLYRLLRLGYLMADRFRYFLEEDERVHISSLWESLNTTYGSPDVYLSPRDQHGLSSDVKSAISRLHAMSDFPIDNWEKD